MLTISARPQCLMTDQTQIQATQLSYKKLISIKTLINKATLPILGFSLVLMTGCSREAQLPQPGEYGEKLVKTVSIPADVINELNNTTMPFPNSFSKLPDVDIVFEARADKNPYRFIIISKGTALKDGKVDLVWSTGTTREEVNAYHPAIYSDDDVNKYSQGESVLLVIPSEPFSVASYPRVDDFKARMDLTKRNNFKFNSIELQVWQGEGSKKDWGKYLIPFSLFLSLLLMAYTVYIKVTDRI